jgi:hypothetical protein
MLLALRFIATLTAAIFAGAALYVNLVEHPARMTLDTRAAALEWAPAYAPAPCSVSRRPCCTWRSRSCDSERPWSAA